MAGRQHAIKYHTLGRPVSSKTTGNEPLLQGNGILTNNGTFNWVDGNIRGFGGVFTNGSTGVINASGNNNFTNETGTNAFNNAGTFTKSGGTGSTTIQMPGNSSGIFNVNEGTINFTSPDFTNTGKINCASGKIFLVSGGTFQLNTGSTSAGLGKFQHGGGTLTINAFEANPAKARNFLFSNGVINGAGTLTVSGGMEWQRGSMQSNIILSAGSVSSKTTTDNDPLFQGNGVLTNNGTFNWVEGNIRGLGGVFNNGATGVINATGNNNFTNETGTNAFNNAGTFTKSNSGGTTTIQVASANTGIVNGFGTINFTNTFASNSKIAPGVAIGVLTINGTQTLSASSTLQIEILNGTGAGTGNDQLSRDGSLTLAGTLTVVETGTVPAGVYTIINCTSGNISGSFATVNLPPCYTIQVNSTNVQVTKTQPPAPTISTSGPRTFCQGGSVTLTTSATKGNTWSNGATTRSIVVSASGNFKVTFTNFEGCTSLPSAAKNVVVNPLPDKPIITADISNVLVCPGKTVTLTSGAAATYLWSTGETTQSIIVNTAGNYSVMVSNTFGCTNISDTIIVTYDMCANPTDLIANKITGTSAKISWTAVTCAVGYQFEWRAKGTNHYSKGQTEGIKKIIKKLLPNTTYEWRVITRCKITPDTITSPGYTNGPEFTTLAASFAKNDRDEHADLKATPHGIALSATIYPNPATSIAIVTVANATGLVQVVLTDLSGRQLWQSKRLTGSNIAIDVSHLSQGTYIVRVKDEIKSSTIKLVKE